MSEMPEGYGDVVVTNWYGLNGHELHVDRAPDVALCSVELLQRMENWRFEGPDLIRVGIDMTGDRPSRLPVFYRIWGWEPQHKALIIKREPVATCRPAHGGTDASLAPKISSDTHLINERDDHV